MCSTTPCEPTRAMCACHELCASEANRIALSIANTANMRSISPPVIHTCKHTAIVTITGFLLESEVYVATVQYLFGRPHRVQREHGYRRGEHKRRREAYGEHEEHKVAIVAEADACAHPTKDKRQQVTGRRVTECEKKDVTSTPEMTGLPARKYAMRTQALHHCIS